MVTASVPEAKLGDLRAELAAAGVFDTRELRSWFKLAAIGVGIAGCFVVLARFGWISVPVVIPAAGALCTAFAMFGHEGSHRSFSKSPRRNALLLYLTFPLFSGLGALYWRDKHDRNHHAHPNVEGLDPDLKPFPFASTRGGHEASGRFLRWFQRTFQRWLFWPMAVLMPTGMRRNSILFLLRQPRTRQFWIEAGCMTIHYAGWVLVPSLIWGPLVAIGVYGATWAISGVCLALVFAPAHMGLPVVRHANHDWQHQIATTRDLGLPRVISFFFIGLDYQLEHHLFPKIPHGHLPRAQQITREWCRERGIEHNAMPYLPALASAVKFMARAWEREAIEMGIPQPESQPAGGDVQGRVEAVG